MSGCRQDLQLPPGFRFHPTDEELVMHYLCRRCAGLPIAVPIIAEIDLYKFDPWQLPKMAQYGEKEWYFFSPRDRKYPNGSRPNRAAGSGYWKATGADKPVGTPKPLAIKKALVFYAGKAPKGEKTNWIMHEYRLADVDRSARKKNSLRLDDWVLCRIYNKKGGLEQPPPALKPALAAGATTPARRRRARRRSRSRSWGLRAASHRRSRTWRRTTTGRRTRCRGCTPTRAARSRCCRRSSRSRRCRASPRSASGSAPSRPTPSTPPAPCSATAASAAASASAATRSCRTSSCTGASRSRRRACVRKPRKRQSMKPHPRRWRLAVSCHLGDATARCGLDSGEPP